MARLPKPSPAPPPSPDSPVLNDHTPLPLSSSAIDALLPITERSKRSNRRATNDNHPINQPEGLIIACDTREQLPYRFHSLPCTTIRTTVPYGDYRVHGDSRFAVERKSLSDAYATLTRGRRRFRNLCERASEKLDQFHIVLEFDLIHDPPPHTSMVKASSIVKTLLSWSVRYGIAVWPTGSRQAGERVTYHLCRAWWLEKWVKGEKKEVPLIKGSRSSLRGTWLRSP